MKLIMPVGIPGCGKSTLALRHLMHNNLKVFETDDIRAAFVLQGLLKSVNDMSRNKEVFEHWHKAIEDALLDGYDVFADATNLRDFARARLREIAKRTGAEIHVIFFTNLSVAISRNLKRPVNRRVPAEAMVRMLEQYERALIDVPTEGYAMTMYVEGIS